MNTFQISDSSQCKHNHHEDMGVIRKSQSTTKDVSQSFYNGKFDAPSKV